MANVKGIFIDFDNLSDDEQIKLFKHLMEFANNELETMTDLNIIMIQKRKIKLEEKKNGNKN